MIQNLTKKIDHELESGAFSSWQYKQKGSVVAPPSSSHASWGEREVDLSSWTTRLDPRREGTGAKRRKEIRDENNNEKMELRNTSV